MKKLVLTVICLFAFASVAGASPLLDFEQGKAAIDLNWRFSPDVDGKVSVNGLKSELGASDEFDGKGNMELGLTVGLGNRFAVQYRGFKAEADKTYNLFSWTGRDRVSAVASNAETQYTPPTASLDVTVTPIVRSHEYNVLYQIDKNFAAFAGVVQTTSSVNVSPNFAATCGDNAYGAGLSLGLSGRDKDIVQFGLVGAAKLAPKTHAYGLVALGSDYRNWEAGLSYEIGNNTELNLNYRATKFEKIDIASAYLSTPGFSVNPSLSAEMEAKGWGLGVTYKF